MLIVSLYTALSGRYNRNSVPGGCDTPGMQPDLLTFFPTSKVILYSSDANVLANGVELSVKRPPKQLAHRNAIGLLLVVYRTA